MLTERALTHAELPLVYDSWIKNFRSSPWAGCLPNHVAVAIHRSAIVDLINAGATLRGLFDGEECVAWVCEDFDADENTAVVHFAYVKAKVADADMAAVRAALAPDSGIYTYKTTWLQSFLGNGFRHRPAFARKRSKPQERHA